MTEIFTSCTLFGCPHAFHHVGCVQKGLSIIKLIMKKSMKSEWCWKYSFIQKHGNLCALQRIYMLECVSLFLSPIPLGHLFSRLRQTLGLLCVSLRYGHWATTHSTHSSVVCLLLLNVEQIDLGVDYARGIFHNFWLASFHPLFQLFCVHLHLSLTHTHIQLLLCRTQLK